MKKSDQLLLAIYRHWPRLDEDITFESAELAWVFYNGLDGWRTNHGWNKVEYPAIKDQGENTVFDRPFRDRSLITRQLTILQANDCLDFSRPSGFDTSITVQLRPLGLLRAESLSTYLGRIDLWYSDHKNGIIGLGVTIIISAATAWITALLSSSGG